MIFRIFILIFLLNFLYGFMARAEGISPSWPFVEKRLQKAGFKKKFIKELKDIYEPKRFEQVLELNVLLYLRKTDDHGVQVSNSAAETVKSFMESNAGPLKTAEKEHGVERSVIASLLWLESRHGENRGRFHVASVYLHLLQATRPSIVKHLQEHAREFSGTKVTKSQRAEIKARTVRKAAWALEELAALQKSYKRDPKLVRELRGSFAGAFGIPQFIPSSYWRWARSPVKKASPDLNKPVDAIYSVAFYLRDHGWKKGQDKTFVKALLKYNNSQDYANAILRLAAQVDAKKRSPSGEKITKRKKN